MTALRFQTGMKHKTSPASLQGYDALQYQAGLQKGWVVQKILSGHNDTVIQIYTYPTPPDLIMGA